MARSSPQAAIGPPSPNSSQSDLNSLAPPTPAPSSHPRPPRRFSPPSPSAISTVPTSLSTEVRPRASRPRTTTCTRSPRYGPTSRCSPRCGTRRGTPPRSLSPRHPPPDDEDGLRAGRAQVPVAAPGGAPAGRVCASGDKHARARRCRPQGGALLGREGAGLR